MKISIPIKGIQGRIEKDTVIIQSREPLKVLSSATLNGGFHEARTIINHRILHMPETGDVDAHIRTLLGNLATSLGLQEPVVGLTTGGDVQNVAVANEQEQNLTVSALITAGVKYPTAAGDTMISQSKRTRTINIVILIGGNPTEACMVDVAKTVTEAKSIALWELDVRSRISGDLASGTFADGIVLAFTGKGEETKFAGTATVLGRLIGRTVRRAVKEAIQKQDGVTPSRPLIKRLEERDIKFDTMLSMALEWFEADERIDNRAKTSQLLKLELDRALSNVNVAALVLAGLRLEEDGRHGLIPGLTASKFEKGPSLLIADKILGMTIADYLAGAEGVLEYSRFDKAKQIELMNLGAVSEDVISGIICGICARVRVSV